MYLLDVLPYDPDRIRRIKPVIDDTINTLRDTIGATKEAVADSVAQTQLILDNAGAQSEASLLWLVVCIWYTCTDVVSVSSANGHPMSAIKHRRGGEPLRRSSLWIPDG